MISLSLPKVYAFIIVASFSCIRPTLAQDIGSVFNIASGSSPGSCDQYMGSLDAQFTEALAMGAAGYAAIQTIQQRTMSKPQRHMLFGMYGLDVYDYVTRTGTKKLGEGDPQRIQNIRAIFKSVSSASAIQGMNLSPKLYCDSTFLKWTEKAIDPETGEPTDQPISVAIPGSTGAYWYNDVKAYVKDDKPPQTSKGSPCEGSTMGFKVGGQNAVVLCPELFASDWKASLQSYKADQSTIHEGDELYNDYKSIPGAFLHEMVHLVTDGAVTDVAEYDVDGNKVADGVSYGFQNCFNLATKPENSGPPLGKDLAQMNADTYHIYALASYFDQWYWAGGKAQDPATLE